MSTPSRFWGYLAVVENPASPEFLEGVAKRIGLPMGAMSAHLRHARLDVTHVAEFDAMLDALPLTGHHVDVLTTSAITAVAQLDAFFADVLEHFDRAASAELIRTILIMAPTAKSSNSGMAEAVGLAVV